MIKSLNSFNFSGFDRDCEEDDLEGRLRQHRQRQSQPDLTTQEHHCHLIHKSANVIKKNNSKFPFSTIVHFLSILTNLMTFLMTFWMTSWMTYCHSYGNTFFILEWTFKAGPWLNLIIKFLHLKSDVKWNVSFSQNE